MRVKFPEGQQRTFVEQVLQLTGVKTSDLADRIGVCTRTVNDWRRERWQMDDRSLGRLCQLTNLQRPEHITLLPEHWSVDKASRLGGRRRVELYGSPGTREGRKLGGQNAQKRFRSNPEYFRLLGVAVRKNVAKPNLSEDLAEFVGILLGDGGIGNYQVKISFNKVLDIAYAEYVEHLVKRLFGLTLGRVIDKVDNALDLVISSVRLVEVLESFGLKRGNKVKQQVDTPSWIWQERSFQIACLRGLIDTDGCVFRHAYRVNGKIYMYTKLAFTNYSRPLLLSAKKLFEVLGLFPTLHKDGRRLYLHDTNAVHKYFEIVGTHNPRYRARFEEFSLKKGEVRELADSSALLMR